MNRRIGIAALILCLALAGLLRAAPAPQYKLGALPDISLPAEAPLTDAQKQHIKDLIASLVDIDSASFASSVPDWFDLQSVPFWEHQGAVQLGQQPGKPKAFAELVAIGPDALPFLLDALDDQTPTKWVVPGITGAIGGNIGAPPAGHLVMNPVNPAESGVVDGPIKGEDFNFRTDYTVKIGDICGVAIGEIVDRPYSAVCTKYNGPSSDAALRDRLRTIWKSDDARRKLFDSLRTDEVSVGILTPGLGYGPDFQSGAAGRLLYYYPGKETAALVADRLDKLDVTQDVGNTLQQHANAESARTAKNGVRSGDFIYAVSWSSQPAVSAAMLGVFKRAGNSADLFAALPGIQDKDVIKSQLQSLLLALPDNDQGPYGDGNRLLTALLNYAPDSARGMFDKYLQNPTTSRCQTVCMVLRGAKVSWDENVLLPLLSDQRTFRETRANLLIRICDEAAVTLSQNHPELKFTQKNIHDYPDLDTQIAAMKTALADKKTP